MNLHSHCIICLSIVIKQSEICIGAERKVVEMFDSHFYYFWILWGDFIPRVKHDLISHAYSPFVDKACSRRATNKLQLRTLSQSSAVLREMLFDQKVPVVCGRLCYFLYYSGS